MERFTNRLRGRPWLDPKLRDSDRRWWEMYVTFPTAGQYVRVTSTATRQRQIDHYRSEGAEVVVKEVASYNVHPKGRLGALVRIDKSPPKKWRKRKRRVNRDG